MGDETGLKIGDRNALFSDIAHAAEGEPTPPAIRDRFPTLSDEGWDAYTRLTTLIDRLLTARVGAAQ